MARSVMRGRRQWMPFVVRTTRGRSVARPASSRSRSTHGPAQLITTRALIVDTCAVSRSRTRTPSMPSPLRTISSTSQ